MSGKIMGAVWDLDLPHSKQLVLLAMADHADHNGGGVFASARLIAWKTGYSERQTQRIIDDLEADKLIVMTEPATPRMPPVYRIDISAGKKKPEYQGRHFDTPAKSEGRQNVTSKNESGVTFSTVRGDTAMSPKPYEPKESNTSCDTASQVTSDATPFPEAPKGFQWVASADSDQTLAHLTTGCMTGPLQCKGKLYHRDFYRPGQKKNPRQPCLECLRIAEDKLKPKQPKPRQPDPVFDAIALGSYHMAKAPNGKGGYIGVLTAGVKECGMLPDDTPATLAADLADMYSWYKKKFPDRDAPAKVETICKYLAEYRQSRRVVADDTNVKFIEHDTYIAPSEVR